MDFEDVAGVALSRSIDFEGLLAFAFERANGTCPTSPRGTLIVADKAHWAARSLTSSVLLHARSFTVLDGEASREPNSSDAALVSGEAAAVNVVNGVAALVTGD